MAAFAGVYVIWGTTYLAIAISIQTLPPFITGALRFLLAGAAMYAWLRWKHPRPFAATGLGMAAVCGVLLSGIGNGFVIWAQQGVPSGSAALVVGAVPIFVLVLDWIFFSRRAPAPHALLGISVALAGVAMIVMHTQSSSTQTQPLYLLALFVAVIGWSCGTLLHQRCAAAGSVISFVCAQMLFGGLFQLSMAFATGEWARLDATAISRNSVLAVLYLVVFGSIIAQTCYLWLLTRVSAQKVTTYALVNPVVALLLGTLVLNERITPLAVAAAILVLAGVALVLLQDFGISKLLRGWRARAALRSTC